MFFMKLKELSVNSPADLTDISSILKKVTVIEILDDIFCKITKPPDKKETRKRDGFSSFWFGKLLVLIQTLS